MDAYRVTDDPSSGNGFPLVPTRNLITGAQEMANLLGPLTTLETDLLTLAAGVYAADVAAKRGEREGFVRDLCLEVPVVNYHAISPLKDRISYVLYTLTSDNWEISLTRKPGVQEQPGEWPDKVGSTVLFSGGLDSLAGTIELLENRPDEHVQLVSHYTRNRVLHATQQDLFEYVKSVYGERVSRTGVRVGGQTSGDLSFPRDSEREPTQRARSFLFLILGAVAARRSGFHEVLMMAENGQMAIHVALTEARLGGFSTHTAHPHVLSEMSELLSRLLSFELTIYNPFEYRTKAECISRLAATHPAAARGRSVVGEAPGSPWRTADSVSLA